MTENGGLVSGFLTQTLLMTEARTGGQFLGRPGVALCSTTSFSTSKLVLFCGCVSQWMGVFGCWKTEMEGEEEGWEEAGTQSLRKRRNDGKK